MVIKNNISLMELLTIGGYLGLKGAITSNNTFIIYCLYIAGAIIILKANIGEFTFSFNFTKSLLLGIT